MSVLLHLSDPHFGTERAEVVAAVQALARAVAPQLVVLSGDITQRARRKQFEAARRFVAGLGVPCLAIPGNHDVPLFNLPARLFAPYAGYARAFGAVAPVHDGAAHLAIGVNTTRWWRHKHGELSAAQVRASCARLRQARAGQLRLVVVHQPLRVVEGTDVHDCVRGRGITRERALHAWAEAGADLVLSGHIHRAFVVPWRDGARPLWCVQGGTAVSRRVRAGEPNAVNLIRWEPPRCTIECWRYVAGTGAFARDDCVEVEPRR